MLVIYWLILGHRIHISGKEDNSMNSKLVLVLVLAGFTILFIIQNVAVVEIQFLFWSIQMSRSMLILFLLAIGMIIGWFLHGHLRYRKRNSNNNWVSKIDVKRSLESLSWVIFVDQLMTKFWDKFGTVCTLHSMIQCDPEWR